MKTYLRQIAAIIWKDVTAEIRTKEIFSAMLVFALLSVFIFQFAFDLRVGNVNEVAPGVLWVAISFAGILGLNRSFILEKDKGSFEGLLLAPADRSVIYFGKMLGNVLFMLVVEIFLIPIFVIMFNLSFFVPGVLLVVLLGTIGFASVGTVFAAIAVNTRAREVLLPILLFPVIVPLLIAAVKLTGGFLDNIPLSDNINWLQLLVAFDVIFIAVAFMTFDFVVEE